MRVVKQSGTRGDKPVKFVGWGYHQVLKLSRTIADLTGSEDVQPVYLFVWYIESIGKSTLVNFYA
jgi:hypothetical protein